MKLSLVCGLTLALLFAGSSLVHAQNYQKGGYVYGGGYGMPAGYGMQGGYGTPAGYGMEGGQGMGGPMHGFHGGYSHGYLGPYGYTMQGPAGYGNYGPYGGYQPVGPFGPAPQHGAALDTTMGPYAGYPGGPHQLQSPPFSPGPSTPTVTYPYYTTRGPRDFLIDNPPSIGN